MSLILRAEAAGFSTSVLPPAWQVVELVAFLDAGLAEAEGQLAAIVQASGDGALK